MPNLNLLGNPRLSASERGYGSRWQKYRLGFLAKHPLCLMCQKLGKTTAATVVDHIKPHKGDQTLFWAKDNHQALCKSCHDQHKKRIEMSGRVLGCGVDGMPLDEGHRWNKQ